MLTLGIPGDSVTAIMIGALSIHGIRCSPMIMTTQPDLFNKIALMLLAANIFLLIFGMTGIRVFAKLTEVPRDILVPIIVVVGILGSYSINNNSIDILWTVIFGIIGYISCVTQSSLSMRFVMMSSARITKKIIVARAYIFGVTVFFVML